MLALTLNEWETLDFQKRPSSDLIWHGMKVETCEVDVSQV